MVEPSTTYEIGRMSVLVAPVCRNGESMWLVCANRRTSERFVGTSAVAWCVTRESAQALARMLAGVEFTRDGAAIWPDGRTEPPDPRNGKIALLAKYVSGDDVCEDHLTFLRLVRDRIQEDIMSDSPGHEPDKARDLIRRLLVWADMMGGWDAHVWAEARAFLRPEPEETER